MGGSAATTSPRMSSAPEPPDTEARKRGWWFAPICLCTDGAEQDHAIEAERIPERQESGVNELSHLVYRLANPNSGAAAVSDNVPTFEVIASITGAANFEN